LQNGPRAELYEVRKVKNMALFKWKINNSLIQCRAYEDAGLVVKLYDGQIKHADGCISRFDFLILSKDELERAEESSPKRRLRK